MVVFNNIMYKHEHLIRWIHHNLIERSAEECPTVFNISIYILELANLASLITEMKYASGFYYHSYHLIYVGQHKAYLELVSMLI